jgi:methylated-DNA-[protein]-cysteine S-methyltransferase
MERGPDFNHKVWQIIRKIPKGRVTSYGEVARALGCPGAARAVGNALNKNPWAPNVPCHRIVKSGGFVGGYAGGQKKKTALLKKEGIRLKKGKITGYDEIFFKFKRNIIMRMF